MTNNTPPVPGEDVAAPVVFGLTLGEAEGCALRKVATETPMAHNSDGSLRGWSVDRFAKGPAYTLLPLPDCDLSALYETVRTLATRPSASLILGHPRTGLDINAKHEATRENFGNYPQFVFALDVDKVAVPVGLGGPDKLPELARHFVDMLGPEFEDVRAVVHATASTGCLGSNLGSLRILYLLKTPWPISHMKGWAIAKNKEWKAAGSPMKVDTNVYVPGKWLFTARPRFVTGLADPVPPSQWSFLTEGERDMLDLSPPANVAPVSWPSPSVGKGGGNGAAGVDATPEEIGRPLLFAIDAHKCPREPVETDDLSWPGVAHALRIASGGEPWARDAWLEWCHGDPAENARVYDTLSGSRNDAFTLAHCARKAGGTAGWKAYIGFVGWAFGQHPLTGDELAAIAEADAKWGWQGGVARALAEVNGDYVFLKKHPQHAFWITRPSPKDPALIRLEGLKNIYRNRLVRTVRKDARGKDVDNFENPADLWLKWKDRPDYRDADYFPLGKEPEGFLNLFRGLPIAPKQGTWPLVHDFLLNVVCDSDPAIYAWLSSLIFWKIQNPTESPQSGLFLTGAKGAGKNTFTDILRRIFGGHFTLFDRADDATAKFNNLQDGCFIGAFDESMFGHDKKAGEALKAQITAPTLTIENKGVPARQMRNCMWRIFLSNKIGGVPIELDDRRLLVLRLSDAHAHDPAYFDPLYAALDSEVPAMVYDALRADLSQWDRTGRRHVPKTKARAEAAAAVATPEEDFIGWLVAQGGAALPMHSLDLSVQPDGGQPKDPDDPWASTRIRVSADGVMDLYTDYLRRRHPRATPRNKTELLAELKRFTKDGIKSDRKRNTRRASRLEQFWMLPPLDDCRAAYDAVTGGAGAWNGDELF